MKSVVVIRDRGQLTIPDAIRRAVNWVAPMSAVSISVVKPNEIIIKPHQVSVDADSIWSLVKRSRSIKGKGEISAVEFLKKDRLSH